MKHVFAMIALFAAMMSADAAKQKTPKFNITSKRADDSVEVRLDKAATLFIVKCPSGISQSVIERTEDNWPDSVILRLHLKGLENFQAANGKVTLGAAVAIRDKKTQVRQWKDGKEDMPLDAKSPYWMQFRLIGGDGKPAMTIPLNDGYFEVPLPKAFFESNPKSITIRWVDFYRN